MALLEGKISDGTHDHDIGRYTELFRRALEDSCMPFSDRAVDVLSQVCFWREGKTIGLRGARQETPPLAEPDSCVT